LLIGIKAHIQHYGVDFTYSAETFSGTTGIYARHSSTSDSPKLTIQYASANGITPGTYYIRNRYTGQYLDVNSNQTGNGTQVIHWNFNGGQNQQWYIYAAPGTTKQYILEPQIARSMALAIGASLDVDQAQGIIWGKLASQGQYWSFIPSDTGYYHMKPGCSMTRILGGWYSAVTELYLLNDSQQYRDLQMWALESTYGEGGSYRTSKSRNQNCLGYVLNKDQDLGFQQVTGATKSSDYINEIKRYMGTQGRSCESIASYTTAIPPGTFRMAFRVMPDNSAFHVIYQLDDGTWAGKNGTGGNSKHFTPNSNPSTTPAMWDNDAYPSSPGTIYFAVGAN